MAFALRAVGRLLGERAADEAAARALETVRSRFDGERWNDQFELLGGNAGIALGALAAGDPGLALLAVTPYLRTAEPTAAGVHWEVRAGRPRASTTSRTAPWASPRPSPPWVRRPAVLTWSTSPWPAPRTW